MKLKTYLSYLICRDSLLILSHLSLKPFPNPYPVIGKRFTVYPEIKDGADERKTTNPMGEAFSSQTLCDPAKKGR
jgi:hypothetical protein